MRESLESYVAGELLSEINCAVCQRKADLTKRVALGSLSNIFIFHLKRFELNFETFQHEKLNNKCARSCLMFRLSSACRFDFPIVVNLEPYTKEGLARRDAISRAKDVRSEWARALC